MTMESIRFRLPFLETAQAQKEVTYNEALALIDMALHPIVEAVGQDGPPAAPALGAAWIVGNAPSGEWAGRAWAIAGWTQGGWRFVPASVGMVAWSRSHATTVRYFDAGWRIDRVQPIAAPMGGATIDAECRAAISSILTALRMQGWLA
jgi:hypothetical protein